MRRLTTIIVLSLVLGASAWAQSPLALSTAGASLALSQGVEALFSNPAHLAMSQPYWVQLRLVGASAGVHSNGLGFDEYRKYNGATLEAEDKADILAQVPAEGWALWSVGSATALAARMGAWGLSVSGLGSARGNLDREAIDLLLHGNADQPHWSFENSDGEGLASWQATLSHGRRMAQLGGGPVYAGLSVSYVRGLYLARADEVRAELATETTGLTGQATAEWVTATGGDGFGVDIGAAWQARPNLLVSIACEHLYHAIRWTRQVERTRYETVFDDLTIDNFEDSLWESHELTEPGDAFSVGLPPHVRVGAAFQAGKTSLAMEGSVWTAQRFAASTTPQVAAAVEHPVTRFLPVRLGVAVGGASGLAVGWGAGLRWGAFTWDVGFRIDRGIWIGDGRGLAASTAIDLSI
jgi:hypothetical protein